MDFENSETNPNSTPKLPLLTMAPMFQPSPERSGMQTPPLHTSASIPFQWEEQPGKPRPCTSLILPFFTNSEPKCLELPPRLLLQETQKISTTKNSSPVTVLGGPYLSRSSRFISSSFRLFRERQGSFDSIDGSKSPVVDDEEEEDRGDFGNGVFLGGDQIQKLQERRGFLGSSWKRKKKSKVIKAGRGREEIGSASFVYRSSMETSSSFWNWNEADVVGRKSNRISNVRKNGSFGTFLKQNLTFGLLCTRALNKSYHGRPKIHKKEGLI